MIRTREVVLTAVACAAALSRVWAQVPQMSFWISSGKTELVTSMTLRTHRSWLLHPASPMRTSEISCPCSVSPTSYP